MSVAITGINYSLKYVKIENSNFKFEYYFAILLFFCIFDQINAAFSEEMFLPTPSIWTYNV